MEDLQRPTSERNRLLQRRLVAPFYREYWQEPETREQAWHALALARVSRRKTHQRSLMAGSGHQGESPARRPAVEVTASHWRGLGGGKKPRRPVLWPLKTSQREVQSSSVESGHQRETLARGFVPEHVASRWKRLGRR
jgi:hypothetical protein